jgi:hypothetical protein
MNKISKNGAKPVKRGHRRKGDAKRMQKANCAFSMDQSLPGGNHYSLDNQVYRITQSYTTFAGLVTSTTLNSYTSLFFSVSNIDQSTSLASIFDEYRIDEIEFWVIPRLSQTTAVSQGPGLLTSVIDYDDAATLTSLASASDYTNAITASGLLGHYRRFKPHAADALYQASALSAFGNVTSPWIDWAYPNTQHYGVKLAISATSSVQSYDFNVRLHISNRNVR